MSSSAVIKCDRCNEVIAKPKEHAVGLWNGKVWCGGCCMKESEQTAFLRGLVARLEGLGNALSLAQEFPSRRNVSKAILLNDALIADARKVAGE